MPKYSIDTSASILTITARSKVHNTDIVWKSLSGSVDATLASISEIQGSIDVDMGTADAGDWLKNRKMRKDMDFAAHPKASFVVDSLSKIDVNGEEVKATLHGTLSYRGHKVAIVAQGEGRLSDSELVATGSFELDMTTLGIKAPKVLMIKIDDMMGCRVELRAKVSRES